MGKWDVKTLLDGTAVAYNDRLLISDQSQTDGSQDRNIEAFELAIAVHKFVVTETSHGLSVGDCVRHNGTSYVEATADTAANAEVIGLVVEVIDTDTFVIQQAGFTDTQSGLTAGDLYYLQDAGGLGTTAGTVEVPILLATDTTDGWVLPLGASLASAGLGDMLKSTYDTNDDGTVDAADVAERVEETSSTTAASGTTETLDLSTASVFNVTMTDNCAFTFSNSPSDSFGFTLILNQDGTGSRTATWPAAVEWAGGTAPTLTTTASATDILTFMTDDGGTTWYGFSAGLDFS